MKQILFGILICGVMVGLAAAQAEGLAPVQVWESQASSLVYSPTGDQLAVVSVEHGAHLVEDATTTYQAIAFSSDQLVSANDNTVTLGDQTIPMEQAIQALSVSNNSDWLAIGLADGTLVIWDAALSVEQARLTGFTHWGDGLQFDPTNTVLVAANADLNQVRLWQLSNPADQVALPGKAPFAFSPDGSLLALITEQTQIALRQVAEVLEREEDDLYLELSGHVAPITALAFSPNQPILASASQDGTISLWDIETGAELAILMGHQSGVTSLSFAPTGDVLVSGGLDGQVILWDVANRVQSQVVMGTGAPIQQVLYNPTGKTFASLDRDGVVILWDEGSATALPSPAPAAQPAESPLVQGIVAYAREDLWAGSHPNSPVNCRIAENEKLSVVARSSDGAFLLYAANCQGAVWVNKEARYFNWEDRAAIRTLPLIAPQGDDLPRVRMLDAEALCQASGRTITGEAPSGTLALYPHLGVPAVAQATVESGVDVLICHHFTLTPIENCHRLGPNNYSYIFTRRRTDDLITLVNYATGQVFARREFEGQRPDDCPNRVARGEVNGDPAPPMEWMPWVLSQTGHEALLPLQSILGGTRNLYATPSDLADPLMHLTVNTPVHPIGQAGDDWWLVLLPDLSQGWVRQADMQAAAQVGNLPNASAIEGYLTSNQPPPAEQIALFAEFRPLGRFDAPGEQRVFSHDGYLFATLESFYYNEASEGSTSLTRLLSLWDIRGGNKLWSVTLPPREVVQITFSPQDDSLMVKTVTSQLAEANDLSAECQDFITLLVDYPELLEDAELMESFDQLCNLDPTAPDVVEAIINPDEEVRLTFFDVATGTIISETGDIDILDAPIIAGNMPQPLEAYPTYTANGEQIIVSYWRRAEAAHCAVWDVEQGSIIWQVENTCGQINESAEFLAILEPFHAIGSVYDHVVIYDTQSGAQVVASEYEASAAFWLDDERMLINRPYGEPPIIWHILNNTVSLVEMPYPMEHFQPQALNRVMFFADESLTYVWDMATGEWLGSSDVQGCIIVELPNRVLVVQPVEADNGQSYVLEALDLETGETAWEIPWDYYRELQLREDALYAFVSFDYATTQVLEMESGEVVGEIPLSMHEFGITQDWEWVFWLNGGQFIVWGLEDYLSLFSDTPHARTTEEAILYYEANDRFSFGYGFQTNEYLWLNEQSEDGAWVSVDQYGQRSWVKSEALEFLRPPEELPIYIPG